MYNFSFRPVIANFDLLLSGALLTLGVTVAAIVLGFVLGVLCAVARAIGPRPLAAIVAGYVEAIRNTPFLVQLFIVYFGLPAIGIQLTALQAGIIAMVINLGAYSAEIIRAGIESIHRLQLEAASALGMTRWQMMRHVVLPPAIENVYPALTSQFILMMLASSLLSAIALNELAGRAVTLESLTFRSFEIYSVVALLYIALTLLFKGLFRAIGYMSFRRWRRLGQSGAAR
ncbi:MAG TPA: amino acid ABC transporter permease [Trueperaceae bacterium]